MRVLVAEDDRQMFELPCAMLQGAGHRAMPAGDGQATLAKLKQSSKTAQIPVIVEAFGPQK